MSYRWAWLAALMLLAGCDRPPAPVRTAPAAPTRKVLQINPLAQLQPNRAVHLAVDSLGNRYYVTETDRGQDGVLVLGESGIPRATQLTSANILAAMGETVGGSGTIQDILQGPDGSIWFFFIGGKGASVRACIGLFAIRSESIRIVFGTKDLEQIVAMGDSLALARGQLIACAEHVNLFLRHLDGWRVIQFDNRKPQVAAPLQLNRLFNSVLADERELNLAQDRYRLSAGAGESLLLTDSRSGELWTVDPSGRAKMFTLLTGLPRDMSRPIADQQGHVRIFAADSEPIEADVSVMLTRPQTSYPALLEITPEKVTAIGREDIRVYGGFPVYAIRIQQLVPTSDGWLAYDLASGQLMRMKVVSE